MKGQVCEGKMCGMMRYGWLLLRAWRLVSRDPMDPRYRDHHNRVLFRRDDRRAQGRVLAMVTG